MDQSDIKTLKTALFNEVEGEKYYKSAAQNTGNPETAKAFLHLAEDEIKHQQMIKEMLKLTTEGAASSVEALNLETVTSPAIFKTPESGNADHDMEISVFHIAILMEKASMDYYRQAAQFTKSASARKLYEYLADWEIQHLDAMEKIYDSLKEDWFEKQQFSPA